MKSAPYTWLSVLVASAFSLTASSAPGAVLCQKRSGVVVVRDACKKKETPLDLAQFGAVGPKGDKGEPGPIAGTPAAGDLTGTYPAPTIAAPPAPSEVAANPRTATNPCAGPTPQTGIYCGTSARYWRALSFLPGLRFWRDRLGAIHIRGAADVSSGNTNGDIIFYLPAGARPTEIVTFTLVIGTGGAFNSSVGLLWVYPDGAVRVLNEGSATDNEVFVGDVVFRPDA